MSRLHAHALTVETLPPPACQFDASTSTLTLTTVKGRKVTTTEYSLECIPSDFGDAFRLTKHVGHPGDECDIYHVCLDNEGHLCECLGYLRHGHCKHVDSLVSLRDAGVL